jgi:hypothetical protein
MTCQCRLEAKLSDERAQAGPTGHFASILQPENTTRTKAAEPLSEFEVAKILSVAKDLKSDDYEMLLDYQNAKGQLWLDCRQFPHPPGSLILPPCALKPREFKIGDQVFSCSKSTKGNSNIQFKEPANNTVLTTIYKLS